MAAVSKEEYLKRYLSGASQVAHNPNLNLMKAHCNYNYVKLTT